MTRLVDGVCDGWCVCLVPSVVDGACTGWRVWWMVRVLDRVCGGWCVCLMACVGDGACKCHSPHAQVSDEQCARQCALPTGEADRLLIESTAGRYLRLPATMVSNGVRSQCGGYWWEVVCGQTGGGGGGGL